MAGSILEVELIEDTMAPIGGKGAPVFPLEGAALGKEAHEVGLSGDGLSGDEAEGCRRICAGESRIIRSIRGLLIIRIVR